MIKEMEYQAEWLTSDDAIILARDFYKDYEYFVVSYGVHPCAYIALREGQPFYNVTDYGDVNIKCHGGCTFVEKGYKNLFDSNHKVIGWDYGHYNDFSGSSIKCGTTWNDVRSKKWTTR